ncbi:MAG: hypothetical protein GY856_49680 [bacterium]|nr:hypothetical protein [bacterium]
MYWSQRVVGFQATIIALMSSPSLALATLDNGVSGRVSSVLLGREHLDAEPDGGEGETLEDLCELKPGECRLACRVRVKGPVEVEIL